SIILFSEIICDHSGLFSDEDTNTAQNLIRTIFEFAINVFWNPKGYFYYQKHFIYFNKISYMRWSQAWMFYALCSLSYLVNQKELTLKEKC
ncbi:hypothetical protein KAH94_06320, partial [bacterium]|nr:hypothetical protein [bacterium]